MSKITLPEAVKIIPVSESTLRRDMRSGKVSSDKDLRSEQELKRKAMPFGVTMAGLNAESQR